MTIVVYVVLGVVMDSGYLRLSVVELIQIDVFVFVFLNLEDDAL